MTATATMPLLECRGIGKRFGGVTALVDVDFTLHAGEVHGLVGSNGAGKSTLMKILAGVLPDHQGTVTLDGRPMDLSTPQAALSQGIAMVYQEPMASLNPAMVIGEQLAEVLVTHEGASRKDAWHRAAEMLGEVRLPDPERILNAYPHQISGGQQQRVVIAMALLSKPALLLLDEPTTALDVTVEAGIVELIKEISSRFGTSMIYISHNLGLILETCDRITVM